GVREDRKGGTRWSCRRLQSLDRKQKSPVHRVRFLIEQQRYLPVTLRALEFLRDSSREEVVEPQPRPVRDASHLPAREAREHAELLPHANRLAIRLAINLRRPEGQSGIIEGDGRLKHLVYVK